METTMKEFDRAAFRSRRKRWLVEQGATTYEAEEIVGRADPSNVKEAVALAAHLTQYFTEEDGQPDQMSWRLAEVMLLGLAMKAECRWTEVAEELRELDYSSAVTQKPRRLPGTLRGAIAVLQSAIHADLRPARYNI